MLASLSIGEHRNRIGWLSDAFWHDASIEVALPSWLHDLRRGEVVSVAQCDPRTVSEPLGVAKDDISRVLGGGQADFESSWDGLSPDDLALLYAYWNQLGHVEELVEAFGQH